MLVEVDLTALLVQDIDVEIGVSRASIRKSSTNLSLSIAGSVINWGICALERARLWLDGFLKSIAFPLSL